MLRANAFAEEKAKARGGKGSKHRDHLRDAEQHLLAFARQAESSRDEALAATIATDPSSAGEIKHAAMYCKALKLEKRHFFNDDVGHESWV
eukprot:15453570-Alexandrium_andersonii.AAC.1